MKLQLNASKIVGLFAFAALVFSTGVIEWNRDAGYLVDPPRKSPVNLELDERVGLKIYVYERCERHQFWIVDDSGEKLTEFVDTFDRILGDERVCLRATNLTAGKWTIHSEPADLEVSVFEYYAAYENHLREDFYGFLHKVSLVILLLVGLGVIFQEIMQSRKARKKAQWAHRQHSAEKKVARSQKRH